ncbi:MAG: sensor histidine kinase [Chloroflexi bacterium]|nr:sensor histidine kinase [Chloroflexota bacterium]
MFVWWKTIAPWLLSPTGFWFAALTFWLLSLGWLVQFRASEMTFRTRGQYTLFGLILLAARALVLGLALRYLDQGAWSENWLWRAAQVTAAFAYLQLWLPYRRPMILDNLLEGYRGIVAVGLIIWGAVSALMADRGPASLELALRGWSMLGMAAAGGFFLWNLLHRWYTGWTWRAALGVGFLLGFGLDSFLPPDVRVATLLAEWALYPFLMVWPALQGVDEQLTEEITMLRGRVHLLLEKQEQLETERQTLLALQRHSPLLMRTADPVFWRSITDLVLSLEQNLRLFSQEQVWPQLGWPRQRALFLLRALTEWYRDLSEALQYLQQKEQGSSSSEWTTFRVVWHTVLAHLRYWGLSKDVDLALALPDPALNLLVPERVALYALTLAAGRAYWVTPEQEEVSLSVQWVQLENHEGTALLVELRDAGPPLDEEDLVTVLHAWSPSDKPFPGEPKGCIGGMGLRVAKELLETYQGALWLEKDGMQGTRVSLLIPTRDSRR